MRKPFYSIVSNKSDTAGEILIYGIIGPDYWGEGIEAKRFVKDLQRLETIHDRINIRINSPGGSIWDGLAIFNAIRASKKEIHTYNDGIAFSMGAMIGIAGGTVHSAKGSIWMLHTASGMAWGNAKDMRDTAEMLEKHDDVLLSLIADKSGKTDAQVKALWMDHNDHFLTSAEAMEAKLVDVIEDYAAKDMPENVQNMSLHQVAAFYNERMEEPSASFLSKIMESVKKILPTPPAQNLETIIEMKSILALKGVVAPTQDQLDAANAELTTEGITNLTLVPEGLIADAATATAENTRLAGELATANASLATATQNATTLGTENAALKAKLAKGPAIAAGVVAPEDVNTDADDVDAILNALPHNQHADKLLGFLTNNNK